MKTALCISGQPRNVARNYENIYNHLIAPNSADVFIHSWIDPKDVEKPFINSGGHVASDVVPENIGDVILDLYKPKEYTFEPQIDFSGHNYKDRVYPDIKPENSLSQRYSVMRSIRLVDNSYDCIVRIRFDWAIAMTIDVKKYSMDVLTCPNDCPHANGINDQFGFGNLEVMSVYSDLFYWIDGWYRSGIPFCDELLLYHHMKTLEIPMNPIHIPYTILRG